MNNTSNSVIDYIKNNKKIIGIIVLIILMVITGFIYLYITDDGDSVEMNCGDIEYEGDGSTDNPYEVHNEKTLQCMNDDLDAHYIQTDDINASDTVNWNNKTDFMREIPIRNNLEFNLPHEANIDSINIVDNESNTVDFEVTNKTHIEITDDSIEKADVERDDITINSEIVIEYSLKEPYEQGFKPIGSDKSFTGSFDGQKYEISNLYIDRPIENSIGLIGTNDGKIENVNIVNTNITGNSGVGGIVGLNDGTVSKSYTEGYIKGRSSIGGLIGYNEDGEVSKSYATGEVNGNVVIGGLVGSNGVDGEVSKSYANGSVTGDNYVSGLIGDNRGEVRESYATGSVTGEENYVGGLIGVNIDGEVNESYATGSVSGDSDVGGFVGANFEGMVSESYWDIETTGQDESDGGIGLTTDDMQSSNAESNMEGFDFTSTWNTVESDYPILESIY